MSDKKRVSKETKVQSLDSWKFNDSATNNNVFQNCTMSVYDMLESQYSKGHSVDLNILNDGIERFMGWCLDFRPFLNLYYVKQHGQISEVYAPNKTAARNAFYGTVDRITEI